MNHPPAATEADFSPGRPARPVAASSASYYRIRPAHGWVPLRLGELWGFRELLYFLVWRDVKVRYKQTALGAAWAVIQPLFTMLVFSIFFGRLAGIGERIESGVPYPIYTYCALLPWQMFATAITTAGNSLVNEQRLISKVYFPRLIVPMSSVLAGLVDFSVAFVILLVMMVYYGVYPGWEIIALPGLVLLVVLTALTVGVWLSALNVHYRDFRYTMPFLTQFWLFITPVAYPSSLVPERYRVLFSLNPMAGVVDGFRWALLGQEDPPGLDFWVSAAMVVLLLIAGLYYFRRMERTFADIV
ncbi:MAG: ABC transporter permease [bacterium]|nr:ABC transporter permease [bacterium]